MKKLISSLTALSLMVASSVPMLTNAMVFSPNYKGNFDDAVSDIFGDNAKVEYSKANYFYYVMSPEKFGCIMTYDPEISVKLKSGSEFDEKSLNQLVWKNCTPYVQCYKSDSDDNTYVFKRHELYLGNKTALEEEVYPVLVDFLSKYDDIVSINKYQNLSIETTNDKNNRFISFSVLVAGNVDFDYNKYANYNVESCESTGSLFKNTYFEICCDSSDTYYKDMYNLYLNLKEDYGEENVLMSSTHYDSANAGQEVLIGENLYTALISGDTNADGEVNISDVLSITAYIANPAENQLNETALINADVNGDGAVTANDALTIQQYLANVIIEL